MNARWAWCWLTSRAGAGSRPGVQRPGVAAHHAPRGRLHRGMTLLELMLALTLSAFVLMAISMAIDLHLRVLQDRRDYVESIQLARAVLTIIANDLRATIQQNTTDFSALASMASAAAIIAPAMEQAEAAADGADTDAAAGGTPGSATSAGGGEGAASSTTVNIAASSTVPTVPGLYGNQYELQLDVSRLPRVDEFQRMTANVREAALQDIPSDVKTVAYYCADARSLTSSGVMNRRTGQFESGLVRRVMDRAVTLHASQYGNMQGLQQAAEVIAPEITSIEFQYFDGTQWLYEWDSAEQQGLPVAVKITVLLMPDAAANTPPGSSSLNATSSQIQPDQMYSLTVRLPTARPVATDSTAGSSSGLEAVGL